MSISFLIFANKNMKVVCYIAILLTCIVVLGCSGHSVSEKLADVESLISAEKNDSAYQLLLSIGEEAVSKPEDRAYYNLLKTRICVLVGKPLLSDSLIDVSIAYYQQNPNNGRLIDAYYYKGVGLYQKGEVIQSMLYYKKAEELVSIAGNLRQQHKVAQGISFINSASGKYDMALVYAKQSLSLAKKIEDKKLLADAYYRVGMAFSNIEQEDSAIIYINQTEPYIEYVSEQNKPYFLSNLGYAYIDRDQKKAVDYLHASLSLKETTRALEYLADIKYEAGEQDEAYQLWRKALTINDMTPKDNIIHNLLEYDVEHGKTDEVCKHVNDIIAIKDSIINKVKNDSLKDLQTRYDHQVEMNASNKRIIRWQWAMGGLVILILCLLGYISWKKHKAKLLQMSQEILIAKLRLADSQNRLEIRRLEEVRTETEKQIAILNNDKEKNLQQIAKLAAEKNEVENQMEDLKKIQAQNQQEIVRLEQMMNKWQGNEAKMIRRGILLYDSVNKNEKVLTWTSEDYEAFINYYETSHYRMVTSLRQRYGEITQRNMLYLILVDMGKSKEDICHIMSLDKQSIRSIKFRLKRNTKK